MVDLRYPYCPICRARIARALVVVEANEVVGSFKTGNPATSSSQDSDEQFRSLDMPAMEV